MRTSIVFSLYALTRKQSGGLTPKLVEIYLYAIPPENFILFCFEVFQFLSYYIYSLQFH